MVTMHSVSLAHWNQLQPGVFRQAERVLDGPYTIQKKEKV
jgi:hypothetical protein